MGHTRRRYHQSEICQICSEYFQLYYTELSNQSHVLKLPPESGIYKDIDNRLKDDMTISMMMATLSDNTILNHPITVSKTSERYNSIELKTLYELFHYQDSPSYWQNYEKYHEDDKMIQLNIFRLKFNIIIIGPSKVEEFVKLYC